MQLTDTVKFEHYKQDEQYLQIALAISVHI
jgi:hypothetical protein